MFACQAGVINNRFSLQLSAQEVGDHLASRPARRIDDGGAGVQIKRSRNLLKLGLVTTGFQDNVSKVGPVETRDEEGRISKLKLAGDVAPDGTGRRGRQRDAGGSAALPAGLSHSRVTGADAVPQPA